MSLATEDIDFLRTLVFRRSGNVLSANQGYLLESRLGPVAATAGQPDVKSLIARVAAVLQHVKNVEAKFGSQAAYF